MPEQAEHEPGTRRALDRRIIVENDAGFRCHPERPKPFGQLLAPRQSARDRTVPIGQAGEVEEAGAGKVRGPEILQRNALHAGQMAGRVEHDQVRFAEMGGKPVGRDERIHQQALGGRQRAVEHALGQRLP